MAGRPSRPGQKNASTVATMRAADANCPVVKKVCQTLGKAHKETKYHAAGSLVFGGLLFLAGAAAWSLPLVFVAFAVICLPWRAVSFCKQRWQMFLIDFCYFVNIATVTFLLWYPNSRRFEALVYALSDGPLAGALVAWQCPWVFGSGEHTVSVLMHLLPGLAVYAHRYHTPAERRGWQGLCQYAKQLLQGEMVPVSAAPKPAAPANLAVWLIGAPLLFYITWQGLYFLVVQVLLRSFILRERLATSYSCLAKRAARTNNFWNRLVRRGSATRRCLMYGLLQLAFTIVCLTVFLPTYLMHPLAFALQIVKFIVPVYYGSQYQMTKVPQHAFLKGIHIYAIYKEDKEKDTAPAPVSRASVAKEVLARSCAVEVLAAPYQQMLSMPRQVYAY